MVAKDYIIRPRHDKFVFQDQTIVDIFTVDPEKFCHLKKIKNTFQHYHDCETENGSNRKWIKLKTP